MALEWVREWGHEWDRERDEEMGVEMGVEMGFGMGSEIGMWATVWSQYLWSVKVRVTASSSPDFRASVTSSGVDLATPSAIESAQALANLSWATAKEHWWWVTP